MSKGSRNRTKDIDKFNENFDKIFGKKEKDITKLKNVWEEKSFKKCVGCNNKYPRDYFPTKQKEYKVSRLDVCKECYKK
tara:strand:+ start:389 stop:625 length:237 start_codon:yes stop_codon:yes gene_type:complete